ncbi:MAG: TatD family hydrolase [Bacteroidota bacterium]|nr:TatD family hydrolase [Bacteroidota bacterium]
MFVDTHAHLYDPRLQEDFAAVLARARSGGVNRILMPAIDLPSIELALALCRQHSGLYAMAALHPTEVKGFTDADIKQVARYCNESAVIAVGETGLDYYWDRSFDDQQQAALHEHAAMAVQADLPIVIHLRDRKGHDEAHADAVQILKDTIPPWDGQRPRGIFHCFTGPQWLIEEAAAMGFLLGIGGVITFRNAGIDRLVEPVPLTACVLETDAPYMTPAPHRGRRNEPAYLGYISERLARLKGVSTDEIARITTRNAERLFRLPSSG